MIARISSIAFVMAILAWPALALGWIPGGLPTATAASIGCLIASYVCYRVLRARNDAEQILRLRAMQQRDEMSNEQLLSYVALHHPNLLDGFFTTFGAKLFSAIKAEKDDSHIPADVDGTNPHSLDGSFADGLEARSNIGSQEGLVTLFPWIAWSDTDTANTQHLIKTVFDKEPAALDSTEAGFLMEMLEAGRKDSGGMFMIVTKSIAESIEQTGGMSMDPSVRDTYGRMRLPEIVKEIGVPQDVIDEMGWDWQ